MRVEVPTFKKCCFCIPLRYGLLIWGYLKLVVAALYVVLFSVIGLTQMISDVGSIVIWVAVVLCLIDLAFSIVFVVGAHKKDYKLLRVFYRFALTVLIIYTALSGFIAGIEINRVATATTLTDPYILRQWAYRIIQQCVIFLLNIALQVYLLFLIRSEVLKLKANCQFEFVNNAAESQCQMKNDSGSIV